MTSQIYLDFNTLMNQTILTDVAKTKEKKENKRKFLERKVQEGVRSQRQKTFSQPSQQTQAPIQFHSPASASNQIQPSY
jgi:CHASE1-domain containing sensor protein